MAPMFPAFDPSLSAVTVTLSRALPALAVALIEPTLPAAVKKAPLIASLPAPVPVALATIPPMSPRLAVKDAPLIASPPTVLVAVIVPIELPAVKVAPSMAPPSRLVASTLPMLPAAVKVPVMPSPAELALRLPMLPPEV